MATQPIDEKTAMPAFVGDDEIEIAGVVYLRQGSQQPVNQRLLDAAKAMSCAAERLKHWHDRGKNNEGMIVASKSVRGIWECEQELKDAITAAEAEIEERRKPVTEEWLKEVGFQIITKKTGEQFACWKHSCVFDFPDGEASIDPDTFNARRAGQSPKTRGDVLDLLRVLGGAK